MNVQDQITPIAEELRIALQAKLRVKGRSFKKAVGRAGRLLPRKLRKQAGVIIKAQEFAGHPKLMNRVQMGPINKAHADILAFLNAIDYKELRRTRMLRWVGGIAFNLIVIVTCFVVWLVWSGNL